MATNKKLRNIGPASARWLREVGIEDLQQLRRVGAVRAWRKVYAAGYNPSVNLAYALEGAIQDAHWLEIPETRRKEIKEKICKGIEAWESHT